MSSSTVVVAEPKQSSNHSIRRGRRISAQESQMSMKASQSLISKRKSNSASVEPIMERSDLMIPNDLPAYVDAYSLFVNTPEYNYSKLSKIKDACAVAADAANREYIQQVEKLKELNELLERRKFEHFQVGFENTSQFRN